MSLRMPSIVFILVSLAAPAGASNLISSIQVQKDPAQRQGVLARIHSQQAPVFQVYDALSPRRVVLEFLATDLPAGLLDKVTSQAPMTKIRVERSQSSAGQLTRLVFEVADGSTYDVRSSKNDIFLRMFLDQDSDDAWQAQERAEKQQQEAMTAQLKADKAKAEQRAQAAAQQAQAAAQKARQAEEQKQLAAQHAQQKLAKAKAEQQRIAAAKVQAEQDRARSEARAQAAEKARKQAERRLREEESKRLAAAKIEAQRQKQAARDRQLREQEKKRLKEQQRLREAAEQKAQRLAAAKLRAQDKAKRAQDEAKRAQDEAKRAQDEAKRAKIEREQLLADKRAAAKQAAEAKAERQALQEALRQAELDKQRLAQQAQRLAQKNAQADKQRLIASGMSSAKKQDEISKMNSISQSVAQQQQALQEQGRKLQQQQREIAAQRAQLASEKQALKVAALNSSKRKASQTAPRHSAEPGFGGQSHQQAHHAASRSTRRQTKAAPSRFVRISARIPGQGMDMASDDDGRMVSPKEVSQLKLLHRGTDDILRISVPGGARYSLNRRSQHSTVITLWDSVIYQLGLLRALDARRHGGVIRYISPEVEGRLRSHVNIVVEHRPGAQIFVQGQGNKLDVIFR